MTGRGRISDTQGRTIWRGGDAEGEVVGEEGAKVATFNLMIGKQAPMGINSQMSHIKEGAKTHSEMRLRGKEKRMMGLREQ